VYEDHGVANALPVLDDTTRRDEVTRLRRARPKSWALRASGASVLLLVLGSWCFGGFSLSESLSARRRANFGRFLEEVVPYPLRIDGPTARSLWTWTDDLLARRGWEAAKQTAALSIAAIVLAGAWGLLLSPAAARNVASPDPFGTPGGATNRGSRLAWKAVVAATRLLLTFARAIPEYVWAFLLLAMLGRQAWPAVLALALHNAGILGRLGAEVVENVEPGAPRALRALGGTRLQVAAVGVLPLVLPRLLLYFFYRWETCVREATVLGLLGFTSLGYWVADARARDRYDEMMLFILLGAGIVLAGDVASAVTRAFVRRAA
jgi:phosphonate transport system permease protein